MENNNNNNEGNKAIEEFWIKNRLPKEVESLPYDLLTGKEQYIIDKVKNGEDLTEEEISIVKKLRIEYEEPLKKYDANEIIKSNEILNETLHQQKYLLIKQHNQSHCLKDYIHKYP